MCGKHLDGATAVALEIPRGVFGLWPGKFGAEMYFHCRIPINVQTNSAQEKPPKSQEGNAGGGPAGKSVQVPIPQSPALTGEGAKRCPDACKGKQASKSIRTDAPQGGKGAKLSDQQGERTPKPADRKPLAKAEEKAELKGKPVSSVAKDSGKEPGATLERPKEGSSTMRKDSIKDGKLETVASGGAPPADQESGQRVGKPPENVALAGAGKKEEVIIGK